MDKLLFYFNIGLLITLTTLYQINAAPVGILNRSRYVITSPKTRMELIKNKDKVDMRSQKLIAPRIDNERHKDPKHIKVLGQKKELLPKNKYLLNFEQIDKALRKYDAKAGEKQTVCFDKSTIYNKPVVMKWLKTQALVGLQKWFFEYEVENRRASYMGLRKQIFTNARSEECHTLKFDKIRPYLECALKRNQRMEYLIPNYPMHQIYYNHLTTITNEFYN